MNFFNPHYPLSSLSKRTLAIGSLCTMLILWALISATGWISTNKLPTPAMIINAFGQLGWYGGKSQLLTATIASVTRVASAGIIVVLIGIPFGILMGASPKLNAVLSPLIDPFRSAPVVAFLPLFVMWLGIGEEMKISFLFVGAVVYLVPLVRDAMVSVPYSYWESIRDLGATKWECIIKGVLPIAAPRIFDAVIVSVSIMWGYITVAEYVNANEGLGQLIQNARRFGAMDQVFVGIFVILILAYATNESLLAIKKKLYPWETSI